MPVSSRISLQNPREYRIIFKMYSPVASNNSSTLTSLRSSNAQMTSYTHSRTNSTAKYTSTASQVPSEFTRVPSNKKLSLTYQTAQFRQQKTTPPQEEELRKRPVPELQMKGRFVSLQNNPNSEKVQSSSEEARTVSQESLMVYFQQRMENLKREYFNSLKEYESRIDELQALLRHNAAELKNKDAQISRLEAAIKETRRQEKGRPEQVDRQLQMKMEDMNKRIYLLANYAEESTEQTRQICDALTKKIIGCFGSRLAVLRSKQSEFIKGSMAKLEELQQKIEQKAKTIKQQPSIGTQGSIQSAEQVHPKYEEGISFWDDCFFYPGERSQNCHLIAQMSGRRSEPLNCWFDNEGYMRYCDSGSFLFNRKGEKITVSKEELQWLLQHNMVKVF